MMVPWLCFDDDFQIAIHDCCLVYFNEKVEKANKLKTNKGKARKLSKLMAYYETNLINIPPEFIDGCKGSIDGCKGAIEYWKEEIIKLSS